MPTILDATVVNQAYDTSGNGGRKLVRLSNGWLVAGVRNGTTNVQLYKSEDNGNTWTLYKTITLATVGDFSLTSKGSNHYVIIAYNNTSLRCFGYREDGYIIDNTDFETWQTALGNVSLAINTEGTELHAAWASKNSTYKNSFNIRYAKGTINDNGSVTWGAVEQVTTNNTSNQDHVNPSIILDTNENPHILTAWQAGTTGFPIIEDLTTAFTTKNGSTYVKSNWGSSSVYNSGSGSYTQSSPSACVDKNGRIWVAWHGGDSGESTSNIHVSYSDDGGITWSTMQKLTNSTANHYQISASITVNKNNEIFIVWSGYVNTATGDIRVRKIKNSSGSWGSITDVTDSNTENVHRYPSALFDLNVNFTEPLFIYKTNSKVGFYGTWTATTISVPQGYIGQKTSADKSNILTYSITTDEEMSDIIEKINDVTITTRTNPTSGQEFTVSLTQEQWDAIKYGNGHTLTIEIGSETWTYTFDKRLNANDDILSAVKGVQDLQDHLNAVKAQLGSAIRAKGGTVNDTDVWSSFVSAVGGMPVKKWASGTVVSSSYTISITGLSFKPTTIIFSQSNNTANRGVYEGSKEPRRWYLNGTLVTFTPPSTNDVSFIHTGLGNGVTYNWIAFE